MSVGRGNPVYPNPIFWTTVNSFIESIRQLNGTQQSSSRVRLYALDCAGLDHIAKQHSIHSSDSIADQVQRATIENNFSSTAKQRSLQYKNLIRQAKNQPDNIDVLTMYYGASIQPDVMESYLNLHPHLKDNKKLRKDLKNLIKYADNLDELPPATSNDILFVEYWRRLPEIIERRKLAYELFKIFYLDNPDYRRAKKMRALLVEDARAFFANQFDLSVEAKNLEQLFEDYFSDPSQIINHITSKSEEPELNKQQRAKKVQKALDFLMQELIDILAMQKFTKPEIDLSDKADIIAMPEGEKNWPSALICYPRLPNKSVTQLMLDAHFVGFQAPEPKKLFIPYLKVEGQVKKEFKANPNFQLDANHFEPEQLEQLRKIQAEVQPAQSKTTSPVQVKSERASSPTLKTRVSRPMPAVSQSAPQTPASESPSSQGTSDLARPIRPSSTGSLWANQNHTEISPPSSNGSLKPSSPRISKATASQTSTHEILLNKLTEAESIAQRLAAYDLEKQQLIERLFKAKEEENLALLRVVQEAERSKLVYNRLFAEPRPNIVTALEKNSATPNNRWVLTNGAAGSDYIMTNGHFGRSKTNNPTPTESLTSSPGTQRTTVTI